MKKTIISAVALILTVLMVVGCNMIVYDAEKDKQTVIATVNGVDVVKGSIMDEIETTLQYAGITDTEDMTEEEQDSYDEIVDAAINELIEYELCRQHALRRNLCGDGELHEPLARVLSVDDLDVPDHR